MAVFSSTTKPKVIAVFGRTGNPALLTQAEACVDRKTGAGKSTFIKNVTGANLEIGHGLESCR